MPRTRLWLGLAGGLLTTTLLAACGGAAQPAASSNTSSGSGTSSSTSSASATATLAPGASTLCSTAPTNPKLTVTLNSPGSPTINSSYAGLQVLNEDAAGADGPFTIAPIDGKTVVEPLAGKGTNGAFTYSQLYFSANGGVPASVKNAELCLEAYDAKAGQVISADFSGTNPAGPVGGAYDAAPEAYVTSGTDKWYTLSFNLSGIAFQSGGSGIAKENGSADFRVGLQPPLQQGAVYFERAWLVTNGVPTVPSLSADPGASVAKPLSGQAPASTGTATASGTLSLQNCTPTTNGNTWKVVATDTKNPPTFTIPGATPTVGNSLASWPSTAMVQMGDCKTTEAWAYTAYDSKNLYLAVKVQSTYPPVAGTAAAPWSGDVVQFAIDGPDDRANHPGNPGGYDKGDTEAGMVLLGGTGYLFADVAPSGAVMPPKSIPGSQVSVTRSNGVTLYEGAIPWSFIGTSPGHTFGLNLAVSAGGPPYAAPYGFEWTHGIIGTKWPYAFAQVTTK